MTSALNIRKFCTVVQCSSVVGINQASSIS